MNALPRKACWPSGPASFLILAVVFFGSAVLRAQLERQSKPPGGELAKAPARAAARPNPYEGHADAIAAGKKLFKRHCAGCHGPEGRGRDTAPDLRSPAIQKAPPGTLLWFLRNGNLKEGMPSWSRLPDERLWQIVSYLKTLE